MNPIEELVAVREVVVRYAKDRIDPAYLTMPHPILADYLEENPHHLHEPAAESTLHALREGNEVVLAQHPETGKVAAWEEPGSGGKHFKHFPQDFYWPFEQELGIGAHHGPFGVYLTSIPRDGVASVSKATVHRGYRTVDRPNPPPYLRMHSQQRVAPEEAVKLAIDRAWNQPKARQRKLEAIPEIQETE